MVSRAPLLLALAVAGAMAGCRGATAEQPMAGDLELCCKAASDDVSFVGCRPTGHCRASESVWIRGPLTCSADTPDQCAGGRCCTLDVEALAARGAPPLPATTPEPEPTTTPEPPPEPAAITPVPLDWQAKPTAVAVPKLICPTRASGTVLLHVAIDETGRVIEVAIREGLEPECDALARDALLHAEFAPALTPDGRPIPSSLIWPYSFDTAEP